METTVAYCRYADDFVVIVKGSKAQAEAIREECRHTAGSLNPSSEPTYLLRITVQTNGATSVFGLRESLCGLGNVPRAMRRFISCLEIPQSLTANFIGIRALLWIISAAVTCASKSFLMLLPFSESFMGNPFVHLKLSPPTPRFLIIR